MKKTFSVSVLILGLLTFGHVARAEFLYTNYLDPSFYGDPNTEYSAWDVFYTPYNNPNYPDVAAPNGIFRTASAAGFTPPANSSPVNPSAFWNLSNPTITQTGTNTAFIIGPGSTGNIYSFAATQSFVLQDTTLYTAGTVLFQYQTEGTSTDFSTLKLIYTDGTGTHSIAPDELLREYRFSASAFGGLDNRSAAEWNLTGLNITSYQIVLSAQSSSMSFQQAALDTSASFTSVVPASRSWSSGNGNWSDASAWSGKTFTGANENGNVNFINPAAATITLDANHTVGQITFDTSANTTINSSGGSVLKANTGITTTAQATGTYTMNSNYAFGAFNVFEINSGTVRMNGIVSGSYGMLKDGDGTLVLAKNNTFSGPLTVQGGTLRLEGNNAYTGGTTILSGSVIVATDAGATGAFGNSTSTVVLGSDSDTFANVGSSAAALLIDGDHTVSRNISLANGTFSKTLGALNTTNDAVFSGGIDFGSASNIHISASGSADKVIFSGTMSGGSASNSLTLDGQGTVIYSGVHKTYANATTVSSGKLWIQSGTSYTGSGNLTVDGGNLKVDGGVSGSGIVSLFEATLSGSGTISRNVVTHGTSSVITTADGKLTLSSLDSSLGGHFVFDSDTLSTPLVVTGLFTGSSATGGLQIDFFHLGDLQAGIVYTLITYGSASGLDASDMSLVAHSGLILDSAFGSNGWLINGENVEVKFSAIPEPSAWQLIAGFLFLLGIGRVARWKFSL